MNKKFNKRFFIERKGIDMKGQWEIEKEDKGLIWGVKGVVIQKK